MRKSQLFFLFHTLIVVSASAQNIISNPGFEEYTKRPGKTSQWHLIKGWGAIDVGTVSPNSPDWYSLKAGGADVRLPHVSWAKEMTLYPKEGNAVAGLIALSNNGLHEYITNTLTRKILKGERVQCSFYYTNGADAPIGKNKARLGVYFSTAFPVSSTQLLQVKPQSQMSKPLFSNEWKLYEVDFIAEEDYSFMTIGCFDEPYDRNLYGPASDKGSFGDWAYYFIDGVSVRTEADSVAVAEVNVPVKEKVDLRAIRFVFKTEDTKEKIKVTGQIFNHTSVYPTEFMDAEVIVTAGQAENIRVAARAEGYFPLSEIINRDSVALSETKTHTFYLSPARKGSTIVLNHIYFNTGSPVLLPSSFAELDRLIELLQANPEMEILISGHTDNLGDPEKDLILSEERAQNVKQYLIEKGIRAARLSAKGYGVTKPIADNRSPLGRAKNRRVEFSIIK
ncbi:MAG: oprF 4 [Cytophagaceae bacterium]|jgi:outer membrane protein OmpA-like peptidoglycan-associated protein|nr:oprF 4 [Cytophagaceae bacterium]